jgi:hypothetical protein
MTSKLFSLLMLMVAATVSLSAQATTGTWSGDVELPDGSRLPFVTHLTVDGDTVTGTLDGLGGETDPVIENGMTEGNTVTFSAVRQIQGEPVTFHYTGELDGDKMTFTILREGTEDPPLMSVTMRPEN